MDDEHIIDLTEYLSRRSEQRIEGERPTFAVWGGEGERARFALPIWRAIYLAGGDRGALVRAERGASPPERPKAFFVLDLGAEPPRTDFPADALRPVWSGTAPALHEGPEGAAVLLGEEEGWRWFLVVDGIGGGGERDPMEGAIRDDLLFLAGECAGLLFHRELAGEQGAGGREGEEG